MVVVAQVIAVFGLEVAHADATTVKITSITPSSPFYGGVTCGRYINVGIDATFDPYSVIPYATATIRGVGGATDQPGAGESSGLRSYHFVVRIPVPENLFGNQTVDATVQSTGLGLGSDSASRSFVVAQNPGFATTSRKCILTNAGNLLTVSAGLAGLVCPECTLGEVTLGYLGARITFLGALFRGISGADPPDPQYNELAEIDPTASPPPPPGLNGNQESALTAVGGSLNSVAGNARALLVSAERAWGAYDAGDAAWFLKQTAAEIGFARGAADAMDQVPPSLGPVQDALDLGTDPGVITQTQVQRAIAAVATGTDPTVVGELMGLGATSTEQQEFTQEVGSSDYSSVAGTLWASVLSTTAANLASSAANLREWAQEVQATYQPSVNDVTPSSGSAPGGQLVTITGQNVADATDVYFGTIPVPPEACSATACQVIAPPGRGRVDVTVATPLGTSPRNSADHFTYVGRPKPEPRPRLSILRITPELFRAATKGPTIVPSSRGPFGTVVNYRDSTRAVAHFTIVRVMSGHVVHGRCRLASSVATRSAAGCALRLVEGVFEHHDKIGLNRFRFTGRLRGRALRPGRYSLRVFARNAGLKPSVRHVLSFRIIPASDSKKKR